MKASIFADHIESKMKAVLGEIERSEVYLSVMEPNASPKYVAALIKYVLLEVFSYGPSVTEATFIAIGRMPKSRPDLMKPMIMHDLEEVDHGEMALKDFIVLGGDESWARSRRITPESFAMGATVRALAEKENPFAYLGYMYLFEALTPILSERIKLVFARKAFPSEGQNFIDFHAEEDVAHAKALRAFIERVVNEYPDAGPAIEYAFDCFAAIYPLPIWNAAMRHAQTELGRASL